MVRLQCRRKADLRKQLEWVLKKERKYYFCSRTYFFRNSSPISSFPHRSLSRTYVMWYSFRKKIPSDPYFLDAADLYGLAWIRIVPVVVLAWWLPPPPGGLVTAKNRTGLDPGEASMIGKRTVDGSGLAQPTADIDEEQNRKYKLIGMFHVIRIFYK